MVAPAMKNRAFPTGNALLYISISYVAFGRVYTGSCSSIKIFSLMGMRRRTNDQRLCLPRIPAFVRCFNIEDLLNTRSKVICSSFVSLE